MKNLITRLMLSTFMLLTASLAIAQGDDLPNIPEDKLEEIKAQKVAYITQKMGFTPDEAQKFWPVYNQYDKELEGSRREMRDFHRGLKKSGAELTEAEADQLIDKELSTRQKELDTRRKYSAEFKKNLGSVRTVKLYQAERDFNKELLKRMRERGGEQRGGGNPGGPPPNR
jgi:Skp family chaperone for outer membrane proteins